MNVTVSLDIRTELFHTEAKHKNLFMQENAYKAKQLPIKFSSSMKRISIKVSLQTVLYELG